MNLLRSAREVDDAIRKNVHSMDDREGGKVKIALWNEAGGDIYGLFSRCRRMVDSVERLLEGEVYHWHSKMIQKEPHVGGPGRGTRITATGTTMAVCFPTWPA